MGIVTIISRHQHSPEHETVLLNVQWIGHVKLSRIQFADDPQWKRDRPWHIVSFGVNVASVETAVDYLSKIEKESDDDYGAACGSSECQGAYLMCE